MVELSVLVARDDGDVVGVADLGGSTTDNLHLADLEIHVRPEHRRQGIGRALYDEAAARLSADGRTSVCGEVYCPPASAGEGVAAYELLTWTGACPEEHLESFCEMQTRMNNDVPVGEIDYQPVVVDAERLRGREERVFRSYDGITSVARRRSDGVFGGYSQLYLPHGADHVYQDDTLVMPEHRGHRLGTSLKLATLEVLQREHPERVALHTDTAVDNHAMQATNRDFGYRPVERMYEMQRRDG